MSQPKYSIAKLKQLLAASPAYAKLPEAKKADIRVHLQAKHVSILQYLYYALLEEQEVNQQNEAELAGKILKISENKAIGLAKKLQVIR